MITLDNHGAKSILASEKKQNPENLVPEFIEIYGEFLRISLNEATSEFDFFITRAENLIDKLNSDNQKSAYNLYFQSDLHLQIAIIQSLTKSYLGAMNQLRKSHTDITQNQDKYPDFVPNLKAIGMMNVMLGSIPEDYNWILSMMGLNGSVSEGLEQLNSLSEKVKKQNNLEWLSTEALLIWNFTALNFGNENDTEKKADLSNLSIIDSMIPSNPLLCYSLATYYRKEGNNEKVISILNSYKTPKGHQKLFYLDYMRGEAFLYKMDASSIVYFNKYLKEFPGNYYRKSAIQKIGWYYLIQNDEANYKLMMERVKTEGAENLDGDKKAMKSAKENIIPNKYLLKSRLLFDGGYYAEAVRVFLIHNLIIVLKSEKDMLEYTYRMGRIYDEWGKTNQAIDFYKKTIEKGKNTTYYFAANSALHLGDIYDRQGKKEAAREMYKLCLSLDFDEYHNSITQKAKAGLSRLEE